MHDDQFEDCSDVTDVKCEPLSVRVSVVSIRAFQFIKNIPIWFDSIFRNESIFLIRCNSIQHIPAV